MQVSEAQTASQLKNSTSQLQATNVTEADTAAPAQTAPDGSNAAAATSSPPPPAAAAAAAGSNVSSMDDQLQQQQGQAVIQQQQEDKAGSCDARGAPCGWGGAQYHVTFTSDPNNRKKLGFALFRIHFANKGESWCLTNTQTDIRFGSQARVKPCDDSLNQLWFIPQW
jgi:hypothetical protein